MLHCRQPQDANVDAQWRGPRPQRVAPPIFNMNRNVPLTPNIRYLKFCTKDYHRLFFLLSRAIDTIFRFNDFVSGPSHSSRVLSSSCGRGLAARCCWGKRTFATAGRGGVYSTRLKLACKEAVAAIVRRRLLFRCRVGCKFCSLT
jgi:hypothetical protein